MVCMIYCAVAVVFVVSTIYMAFAVDKTAVTSGLMRLLSPEQKNHYLKISRIRRSIYLQGMMLGLIFSFVAVMARKSKSPAQPFGWTDMCMVGGITFLTVYFYYILARKPQLMVVHLDTKEQREAWAHVYKTMCYNYHVGLFLGVLAVVTLMRGLCD